MLEFFTQRLGNSYVIGLGGCEIIKIWFKSPNESNSVLEEEQAKELAEGMCDWFKEKFDVSSLNEEDFGGDSEKTQFLLKLYDEMARSVTKG